MRRLKIRDDIAELQKTVAAACARIEVLDARVDALFAPLNEEAIRAVPAGTVIYPPFATPEDIAAMKASGVTVETPWGTFPRVV